MRSMRVALAVLAAVWATACNQVEIEPTQGRAAADPGQGEAPRPPAAPDAPDVVLITIDTLRADHVGGYGAPDVATPALDALIAEGLRFERAYATAPLTLPSHASMLTGLYPPRHGVRHNGVFHLGQEAETLAESFQAAGFHTGAVVGSFVLSAQFGLHQGFDHYDDQFGEKRSAGSGFQERTATQVTDHALAWLATVDDPFFLWVHYYDPHADYQPPAPWSERFAGRLYDGEVAYVDSEIGRLIEALEERGRFDRTVVAVTSDHGEALGEHGESTHGYFLYDAVLRVPLILRGPGLPSGQARADLVSGAAVAPTLAQLAGLSGFDEVDVASLLGTPVEGQGPPYSETLATELDFGWAPLHATRSGSHSYIRAPRRELFDAVADPRQERNLLAGVASPAAAAVQEELDGHIAAILAAGRPLAPVEIDAQTAAQMQALGYLVSTAPTERTGMDPKDGQRWIELSMAALGAYFDHRFDDARRMAQEVLEAFPDSGRMHGILARIAVSTGRPDQALPHAEMLLRLQPASADHHALLGLVRLRLGDLPGAVAAFESGLQRDPEHHGAHLGAMWKLKVGGSVEDAAHHAERAIALGGGDVMIMDRVAETWEGLGQYEQALATYQRASAMQPDSEHLHMRLAIQYARLDDREPFLRHVRLAGAAAARPDMRNRLGIALAARGAHAEAELIFRELLGQHPGNRLARLNLGRLLDSTGRSEEAAALRTAPAPAAPAE